MSSWEQYQTAYQASSEEVQSLLNSTVIPDCVEKAVTQNKMAEKKREVTNLIVDFYLDILTEQAVIEKCSKSGIPEADTFFQRIQKCISSPTERIDATELKFETTEEETEKKTKGQVNMESKTLVAPLHTMATDIEKIHGYGALAQQETATESNEPVHTSSQDSVLARPKVADMPSYTPEPKTDVAATKPDVPPAPTPSTPAAPTGLPTNNASIPSFTPTSSKPTDPTDAEEPASSAPTKPDTRWSSSLDNS
jgi:hypothetical protein